MLALYSETNILHDFSRLDFDRIVIITMGGHQLDNMTNLEYYDCHGRMIWPGGAYIFDIKLADGDYYLEGHYGDTDDEGNLPTPMAPHKLNDYANHSTAARKRQRTTT